MYRSSTFLGLCLFFLALQVHGKGKNTKPNVILLVTDDWGFNDVPWHKHTDTQMPFLTDFIKNEALTIDSHYVYPLCSITRSALVTGRYPIRFGLQSSVIENGYPFGLSVFEKMISNDMQENEYKTAAVGKWHLGFHRPDLCPLHRGFDAFHGSLSPMLHYYSHDYSLTDDNKIYNGYDLRINDHFIENNNKYLSIWETEQFIQITTAFASTNKPFFIYLAMHASHFPLETTEECIQPYMEKLQSTTCLKQYGFPALLTAINSCDLRIAAQSVTTCADHALKQMIDHLKSLSNVWSNTLLIGISDNGAFILSGDNYPLRGGKAYLYEGGVRTPAFIAGGYLNNDRKGKVFDSVMHVTDWYPTILSAIGLSNDEIFSDRRVFDGKNMWNALQYGTIDNELSLENREFLYNIDSYECKDGKVCGAYRYGRYKIIGASNVNSAYAFWTSDFAINAHSDGYMDYLGCGSIPDDVQQSAVSEDDVPCSDKPCLFDIVSDPCEYYDLSNDIRFSNLYQYMYNMLLAYDDISTVTLVEEYENSFDTNSDPLRFRGFWMPWMKNYGLNGIKYEFEEVLVDKSLMSADVKYTDIDVSQSKYYAMAMEYKIAHEAVNAMLVKRIGGHVSVERFEKMLKWMTFVVAVVVIAGVFCLAFKWYQYCMYGTLMERESKYIVEFPEKQCSDVIFDGGLKKNLLEGSESSEYEPLLGMITYAKSEPTTRVQKNTIAIYPKNGISKNIDEHLP